MAYRLETGEPLANAMRRVVTEQMEASLAALTGPNPAEGVHEARKSFKKIRAALRLVRPTLGATYRVENTTFRAMGRGLSALRDAEAMRGTWDTLYQANGQHIPARLHAQVADILQARQQALVEQERETLDACITQVTDPLREALHRVESWPLPDDFGSIAQGFEATYRRGRKALKAAYTAHQPAQFHAWRRRVKDHWYHVRLMENVWPSLMACWHGDLKALSELLGDDHNLVVLHQTLLKAPDTTLDADDAVILSELIGQQQRRLRGQARPLGERLYAERPKALRRRIARYWDVWRR